MQISVPFLGKTQIARNTWLFRFEKPKDFVFLSGQYLSWKLPDVVVDPFGSSRYFTISSSAFEDSMLAIATEKGESIYKKKLFSLRKGEEILISQPMGGFYLRATDKKPQVFLSGDIGITPFYAMVTDAVKKKMQLPITLIAQFSTKEDICFYDELIASSIKQPSIRIVYTLTHPQKSKQLWQGEKGSISEALIRKYIQDPTEVIFSIVGSPRMIEQTQELLLSMKVPLEHIKLEQFSGY